MACCEASKLDAARARLAAVKLKERVAALGQELADVFALLVLLEGHLVGGATCKRSEIQYVRETAGTAFGINLGA